MTGRANPADRAAKKGVAGEDGRGAVMLDKEGVQPCTALGEPATLILLGPDYDGGHKAWIRWPDGADDIVPGSRVQDG